MGERDGSGMRGGLGGRGARDGRGGRPRRRAPRAIRRLRLRFVGAALLATALVLTGLIVGINVLTARATVRDVDQLVDYIAQAGGSLDNVTYPYDNDDPADFSIALTAPPGYELPTAFDSYAAMLEGPYAARYFTVTFDDEGRVATSDTTHVVSVSDVTAMQMAQEALQESSPATPGSARGTMGDYRYLVTSVSGTRLAVFLNVHDELASQRSFLRASALTGVVGVLAFACLIVPFSFAVSAPVERAQRAQRRFVTDASHELRTPIAIISSATDVVEIDAGESEWTRSIHNQTRRLARLTDRLVMLSRADEGADALRLADVDLSALVREMAGDFEAVAYSRGKHVETHVADDVTCRVDEAMTRQVVSTLLDNALKYSADASTVAVSLAPARHGMATLTVTNAVVRIEPGAHPELFERFYRADASRSSGSGGTGAGHGIGLAIVRAVAEAHGGDATARSDDGRSLTITVTL